MKELENALGFSILTHARRTLLHDRNDVCQTHYDFACPIETPNQAKTKPKEHVPIMSQGPRSRQGSNAICDWESGDKIGLERR